MLFLGCCIVFLNLTFGILIRAGSTELAVSFFRVILGSFGGVFLLYMFFFLLSRHVRLLALLRRQDAVEEILSEIEIVGIKHNAHEPGDGLAQKFGLQASEHAELTQGPQSPLPLDLGVRIFVVFQQFAHRALRQSGDRRCNLDQIASHFLLIRNNFFGLVLLLQFVWLLLFGFVFRVADHLALHV